MPKQKTFLVVSSGFDHDVQTIVETSASFRNAVVGFNNVQAIVNDMSGADFRDDVDFGFTVDRGSRVRVPDVCRSTIKMPANEFVGELLSEVDCSDNLPLDDMYPRLDDVQDLCEAAVKFGVKLTDLADLLKNRCLDFEASVVMSLVVDGK